ncbi:MAG: hypothetical protein AB7J35_09745 [Dehalococcoidia bacterium]
MNYSLRLAGLIALLGATLLAAMGHLSSTHAQDPRDVPWAQVPDDLKTAIKVRAEADWKPYNIAFGGSCETAQGHQVCARVLTLDASRALVAIGLVQSEAAFFDFTKGSAGWSVAPAAPATGTGATTDAPMALWQLAVAGSALLGLAAVAVLWERRRVRSR